jgi:integrase
MARHAKPEFKVQRSSVPNGEMSWFIIGRPNGKRVRAWFPTKEKAQAEATERNIKLRRLGSDSAQVDNSLIVMAQEGASLLQPFGKTLRDAVEYYAKYLKTQSVSAPVTEFASKVRSEFARRLKAGESSVRHHTSMLETLKKFEQRFASRQLATLSASEIKTWLAGLPLAIKTRNRHLGYLRNAFGLAVKELHVLSVNPLDEVTLFKNPKSQAIEILTPEQMIRFLSVLDRDWLPFFSISAFTGLRREEVSRLDWSEIKLDRSLIDLPREKSKNNHRKLEEIPENLSKILSPFARPEGSVKPKKKLQYALENAATAAGIEWKQNCLRHSFCSYAVATKGLDWTALQADHSTKMLRDCYLEVVSKEDAAKYWSIVPA